MIKICEHVSVVNGVESCSNIFAHFFSEVSSYLVLSSQMRNGRLELSYVHQLSTVDTMLVTVFYGILVFLTFKKSSG